VAHQLMRCQLLHKHFIQQTDQTDQLQQPTATLQSALINVEIPYTLKCSQLIQQRLLATECRAFGDNSAAEFRGISQTALQNLSIFAVEIRGAADHQSLL